MSDTVRGVLDGLVRHLHSPMVFVDDEGNDYTSERRRSRITTTTSRAMRTAGIENASFHTIRHTAAA